MDINYSCYRVPRGSSLTTTKFFAYHVNVSVITSPHAENGEHILALPFPS